MTDIEISRKAKLEKVNVIADKINLPEEFVENYGDYKAKISTKIFDIINNNKNGKLILVTSINPTPLGEGKTTAAIGICDGLNKIGKKSMLALREPSMGPVFGLKGGATGGGYSQIAPMEDINLHFTGDIHALTSANNLLSSAIDNHIFQGNELKIKKVVWKRCLDVNDRALRNVVVGINKNNSDERNDSFDITAASEMMAILCLANDIQDLKRRIGNIIIGYDENNNIVKCKDLHIEGSLTVLLKDAIKPNLVQTLENNPCLVHGGPFANIAHGCNSIIATKMALKLSNYVVTEAGFGADLGAEKFLDIKERKLNIAPDAVVIVATLKALKYHGGASVEESKLPNIEFLKNGFKNLLKHIDNIKQYGINPVVGINVFDTDNEEELNFLKNELSNVCKCEFLNNWSKGSEGAIDMAKTLVNICEEKNNFRFLYDLNLPINEKIDTIAKKIYGAKDVIFDSNALEQIKKLEQQNIDLNVPICIAKTQYSLSDDPNKLICDEPFVINIKDVEYKGGAEFIVVKTGNIMTMPGLPKKPAYENIDIDNDGNIQGIF